MPQITPAELVRLRATASVAAAHAAANSQQLLRVGGATNGLLDDGARSIGMGDVRGRLTALRRGMSPVTEFLRSSGTDATALGSRIDDGFSKLEVALSGGQFASPDHPGPSPERMFTVALGLQNDIERARDGIEGLVPVQGDVDAARAAGLVQGGDGAWETAAARQQNMARATTQARQAVELLDTAKTTDENAVVASLDGAIERIAQAMRTARPDADASSPAADAARAIVMGASRGKVRDEDLQAMRALAARLEQELAGAAPGSTVPSGDAALAEFVRATAGPRARALQGVSTRLGAGATVGPDKVDAMRRTIGTLSGLFDSAAHLVPAERAADADMLRAAAAGDVALDDLGKVDEVGAAADRLASAITDTPPEHALELPAGTEPYGSFVPDPKLPFHQIHEGQVDAYLRHSALQVKLYHRTSYASRDQIIEHGPEAMRNNRMALGRGFYSGTVPQTSYGPGEVQFVLDATKVADGSQYQQIVAGARTPDEIRQRFLDRGYSAVKNGDIVVVYDLSGARIVVPD